MKPQNLQTKIFLDSGDPNETRTVVRQLGFLDGQTTNPTLIAKKNPDVKERLDQGQKFLRNELVEFYREVVEEISGLMPRGSVSVEVYANVLTKAEQMLAQAREMFAWVPTAHIKCPITKEGLFAAHQAVKEGMRVNMTLCFTQEQAVAVYGATQGAKKGDVFISPFIGRLDDKGENGMDLIENILKMNGQGDGHVQVLCASVRNLDHMLRAIQLGSDIITAPAAILLEWAQNGMEIPDAQYRYPSGERLRIPFEQFSLEQSWELCNIYHDLTALGVEQFAEDWDAIIKH